MDGTALHLNLRGAGHRTGRSTIVRFLSSNCRPAIIIINNIIEVTIVIEIELVLTDTGACPIDITAMQPLDIVEIGTIACIGTTYLTAVDGHLGITTHMAVLTTAID